MRGSYPIDFDAAHQLIGDAIIQQIPFACGKLGGTETRAIYYTDRFLKLSFVKSLSWKKYAEQLYLLSGVYPVREEVFYEFADLYKREVLPVMDYLYLWQGSRKEAAVREKYASGSCYSVGYITDFAPESWIKALRGKRVLVVSPFSETVRAQYAKRMLLWPSLPDIPPEFELVTLSCPLYSHLVPPRHPDWKTALDFLKGEMDSLDYDVLLVGAGAWGLPLAAHAKVRGKVGIHMGGAVQLVFGIKGGRWDSYGIYNEHWVYPDVKETPQGVEQIEGACYWKPQG
ncbi:MAG: hypothetical protein RLZZ142_2929 [Verrucomicrobiota bacterium]|jgi:hypothetical protein